MAPPFFRGLDNLDLLALCSGCAALNWSRTDLLSKSLSALEPFTSTSYLIGQYAIPAVAVSVSSSYVVITVQGTVSTLEWIGDVLGSLQGPNPGYPGSTHTYDALAATLIWDTIGAAVRGHAPGRSIVLTGHSLGGAVAQLLGVHVQAAGLSPWIVWSFGSPRVGNAAFTSWWPAGFLSRIQIADDPFPALPPDTWAPFGPFWFAPGPPPLADYRQAGSGFLLSSTGGLQAGEVSLSLGSVVSQLEQAGTLIQHFSVTYCTYLRAGLPSVLPDGFNGFATPSDIDRAMAEVASLDGAPWPWGPTPAPRDPFLASFGGAFMLRGTLFFGKADFGWSESYLFNVSQYDLAMASAQKLASDRLNMCTDDVSIPWIRISDPTVFRDAIIDTFSARTGSIGKMPVAQFQPSGPDDALTARMTASPTAFTRIFLRGFPAMIINGQNYNFNNGFGPRFALWANEVVNGGNNIVLQSEQRPQNPYWPATNVTPLYPRGFSFVVPAGIGGITPGMIVFVAGAPKSQGVGYNGRKIVTASYANTPIAGQTTVYVGGARPVGVPTTMFVRTITFVAPAIAGVQPEFITRRSVGRPFGQPRGRRANFLPLRL